MSGVTGYEFARRVAVRRHYKTGLLKIGRIWRNHVTQVWTISYSAVCRFSYFEQQAVIFPVDGAPELFFRILSLGLFRRTYVSSLQEVEKFAGYGWNTLMQVCQVIVGFYLKLLGCLLTRLNYFSCLG